MVSRADAAQAAWVELMEVDGHVAGLLTTRLQGGRISPGDVRTARESLASQPEWAEYWPERHDLLTRACEILTRPGGA